MTFMRSLTCATAALALGTGMAAADPAIVFDLGGKFDKSFNESAFNGATRWAEETGGSFREIEMQSEAQREQALRRLAESGSNPVVMTGFAFGNVLAEVAPVARLAFGSDHAGKAGERQWYGGEAVSIGRQRR